MCRFAEESGLRSPCLLFKMEATATLAWGRPTMQCGPGVRMALILKTNSLQLSKHVLINFTQGKYMYTILQQKFNTETESELKKNIKSYKFRENAV